MSNRTTQKNIPLPVLGSTGWGSNLNSYLRANSYRQSAIEEDLQDLYEQQNNATQTILSSGVMSLNVDTKKPGLYKNTGAAWTYVNDGDEIEIDGTYGYFGYGAVLSNVNVVKQLETTDQTGVDHHVLTIDFAYSTNQYTGLDLQTSTSNYDARCVYAYYNNNSWSVRFATTTSPSTETSISIHPQYICLGIVIQFGTKLYWHYKTMKSSLSLSVKKWMLDEPHASLDTYMNFNAGNKTLVPFVVSQTQPTKLHIQALGINPFSVNESITSELDADLFTMDFATKNSSDNVVSNFVILHAYNDGSNTVYSLYTPGTIGGVTIDNYSSTTKYRICATSLRIDTGSEGNHAYKWVLLLQEAINDSTLNTSLFNDNDFNRLYYYADPIELYRLENSSLHANPGNGISTINANGINPHISTLLKNDDDVFFGELNSDYFHFKTEPDSTSGVTRSGVVDVVIPNATQTSPATSVVLTDNMQAINTEIQIQNTLIGTGSETNVDNKILMRAGRAAKNYNNLSLHSHQGSEGGIMHFSGTGAIKLQAYASKTSPVDIDAMTDAQASIDIYSKEGGDVSKAKIDLKSKYINLYGDTAVVPVTKNFQFNDGTSAYCVVQNPDGDRPKLLIGKTTGKKIGLLADGDKATIKVGNVSGGDCTTLSSDGLYLPSGSGGVVINQVQGEGSVNAEAIIISYEVNKKQTVESIDIPSLKNLFVASETVLNPWTYVTTDSETFIRDSINDMIIVTVDSVPYTLVHYIGGTWYYSYNGGIAGIDNHTIKVEFTKDSEPGKIYLTGTIKNKTVNSIYLSSSITAFKKPLVDIKNISNGTMMHIGDIAHSVIHFSDQTSEEGHIFIDKFNHKALKILEQPGGSIVIDKCTGGGLSIGKSDTNHTITIDDNRGYTHLKRSDGYGKWLVASGNLITPSNVSQDTRNAVITAINKISTIDSVVIKKDFWYYRDLPKSSGNRENSESQITIRRFFNYTAEVENEQDTKTIMLPELRKYTIYIEILDDQFQQAWNIIRTAEVNIDPLNTNTWEGSVPTTSSGSVGGYYKISPHNGHFKLKVTYDKWWSSGSTGNWCALITVTEDEDQDNYSLKRLTW